MLRKLKTFTATGSKSAESAIQRTTKEKFFSASLCGLCASAVMNFVLRCSVYLTSTAERISTGVLGTSEPNGPPAPVGKALILSTTVMPSTTLPNTV